jgi:hypothetical protein
MVPVQMSDLVARTVLAAKESGATLSVCRSARELAAAAGCPDRTEEIADALMREGIRQRIPLEFGGRRPG